MSAREEAIRLMEQGLSAAAHGGGMTAHGLIDSIIEAVKEEIQSCPFPEPCTNAAPAEKIQGYTAEQWHEIIDGGYLCEFTDGDWEDGYSDMGPLVAIDYKQFRETPFMFERIIGRRWVHCRPAQLKGILRPIWVEPESEDVRCVFFHGNDSLHAGTYQWKYRRTHCPEPTRNATSYIEL